MRKYLLAGAILLGLGGLAAAQPITQQDVTGNECWNAGQGPGGPTAGFVCMNVTRNGTAMQIFSGSGTVNTTLTQANSTVYWHSTAPTAWNITLPSPAFDGEVVSVATDTTLTTMVTITAGSGQSLSSTYNAQTLSANTSVEWQYSRGTTTWYRVR